jgi:hypothetical protein
MPTLSWSIYVHQNQLKRLSTRHSLLVYGPIFQSFRQLDFTKLRLLYLLIRENVSCFLRIKQPTRCYNIQHLFCHKTLHVSGIFCACHQELSIVRTAIGRFHAGYVTTSWQAGWNGVPTCLLTWSLSRCTVTRTQSTLFYSHSEKINIRNS